MPKNPKPLWTPDWSNAPKGTIGCAFNRDGIPWWWTVKPSLQVGGKYGDVKWRGPEIGKGYDGPAGERVDADIRKLWKSSWVEKP